MGFVNTRTELGERSTLDMLLGNTIADVLRESTGFVLTPVTSPNGSDKIGGSYFKFPVKKVVMPYATNGTYYTSAFWSSTSSAVADYNLEMLVIQFGQNSGYVAEPLTNCNQLEVLDLIPPNFTQSNSNTSGGYKFYGKTLNKSSLRTFIMRTSGGVSTLSTADVLNASIFGSGGSGGVICVPQDLISRYKAATNWSTYDSYGTINWQAIESTYLRVNGETGDVDLVTLWQADTKYRADDIVYFEDKVYRCIQAHTSLAEATPDTASEYWAEVLNESISDYKPLQYHFADGSPISQKITTSIGAHTTCSNSATWAWYDDPYEATVAVEFGYFLSVTVTMNGTDITESVYNSDTGVISIAQVKGPVTITTVAT